VIVLVHHNTSLTQLAQLMGMFCLLQVVELIWITVDPATCVPNPEMTGLAQLLVGRVMALRPRFSVALHKAIAGERLSLHLFVFWLEAVIGDMIRIIPISRPSNHRCIISGFAAVSATAAAAAQDSTFNLWKERVMALLPQFSMALHRACSSRCICIEGMHMRLSVSLGRLALQGD
jgi:hypothetical protein